MIYCLWITKIKTENIAGDFAGPAFFGRPRGDTASGVFPASSITSPSLAFGVVFGLHSSNWCGIRLIVGYAQEVRCGECA